MNVPIEPRPEPPAWTPPSQQPPDKTSGSIWLGFGLAWLVVVGGPLVAAVLIGASSGGESALTLLALPWLGAIGLFIGYLAKGRPRTAIGLAIGVGTILAIALLLVAACFSLFATSFH